MTPTLLTLVLTCLIQPENLAAGKSCRLEPSPNYEHCTDPGDRTQLTDGKRVRGYFWTQQGTVGWSGASHAVITIDLGVPRPISGVSFHTAAGVAGVELPQAVIVLVSDDGQRWRDAGDLVAAMRKQHSLTIKDGYSEYLLRAADLATRGRYVALLVEASGPFVFVDEIEVFRGPDALLARTPSGPSWLDVRSYHETMRTTLGVRRRVAADCAEVVAALKGTKVPEQLRRTLRKELEAIEAANASARVDDPATFRTVLPMTDLHRRLFAVQAAVWRARGHKGVVVWPADRWGMLSPTQPPCPGDVSLSVAMMSNEYRSTAFNLSNAGETPARMRMTVEGLPGGINPPYLRVFEVPFTDTRSGVPVAAALVPVERHDRGYEIELPLGLTRQVWLTFSRPELPASDHDGRIALAGSGLSQSTIPLQLHIAPVRFPHRPALHLCGWDYTDQPRCYEVNPTNRDAFLATLREHFVDCPWAQSSVLPSGSYDADGKMTAPPDSAGFRVWHARWKEARNYYVFMSFGETFAGLRMGTPAFQRAVGAWITWWVKTLGKEGVRPEQLGLLLVDEPRETKHDRIIIEYAKAIRAAEPKVVIWEDPIWRDPAQATPGLFEACDVLCPNLPMWIAGGPKFARVFLDQKRAGRRLWFYSCSGPGRLLDPYGYHRLSAWSCWKYGALGEGFWAFGDGNGASSWNEYLSSIGSYTPLFLDATTVTGGKHMEAIREGVEDFEYLRMLRDRVRELESKSVTGDDLAHARSLLESAADRVLAGQSSASLQWKTHQDRGKADLVRIEILDAITRLARY
ncbi:MAG: discoidin domain-containing protein [Isosphaeraceae bacterium]